MESAQRSEESGETRNTASPKGRSQRARAVRVGVLVVVALVLAAVIYLVARDDSSEVFGADSALEVVEAHFAAFNDGDAAAAIAYFTDDVTFSNNFTGPAESEFSMQRLEWNVAQGTDKSPVECSVADVVPGESVRVSCSHGTHDAVAQAVGAPAVATVTGIMVTDAGISAFNEAFGSPDFGHVGEPFERWMSMNNPADLLSIGFGEWTSVGKAIANGESTAQFAAEWATYLEANDCGYRDGC